MGGVPRAMPSLTRAARVGEKVAGVGFDWKDSRGSRSKGRRGWLLDLFDQAIASGDKAAIEEELGDTLFALVNLSRHVGVDPEGALRGTIDKFATRFAHVEKRVRERHGGWGEPGQGKEHLPLETLDAYWERGQARRRVELRAVGWAIGSLLVSTSQSPKSVVPAPLGPVPRGVGRGAEGAGAPVVLPCAPDLSAGSTRGALLSPAGASDLPKPLRAQLEPLELEGTIAVTDARHAVDGTRASSVVAFRDGATVETVLIPGVSGGKGAPFSAVCR